MSRHTIESYRKWLNTRIEVEKFSTINPTTETAAVIATLQGAKNKFDEMFPIPEEDQRESRVKPLGYHDNDWINPVTKKMNWIEEQETDSWIEGEKDDDDL